MTEKLTYKQLEKRILELEQSEYEHKKAEKALQESEAKFKGLVEFSSDWIWEVDENATYTYSSPQVEAMLGYKPEKIIGLTPFDLIPPEEAKKISKFFMNIIKKGTSFAELENVNRHKDGRLIVLETNGVPICNKAGKVIGYRGIDRNITERKWAQKGREKLLKALQKSVENVKTLNVLLPICACCKKIRDDKGHWNQIEEYIEKYSHAKFSHGLCPECSDELYGKQDWFIKAKKKRLVNKS